MIFEKNKRDVTLTRNLENAIVVHSLEYGVHQGDVLDDKFLLVDVDAVTDIVWVLDEEEDAARQELGDCAANSECQTSE